MIITRDADSISQKNAYNSTPSSFANQLDIHLQQQSGPRGDGDVTREEKDNYIIYTPANAITGKVYIIGVTDQYDNGFLKTASSHAEQIARQTGATVIAMTKGPEEPEAVKPPGGGPTIVDLSNTGRHPWIIEQAMGALKDYVNSTNPISPISDLTIIMHGHPNAVVVGDNKSVDANFMIESLAQNQVLANQSSILFFSCNVEDRDIAREHMLESVQTIKETYNIEISVSGYDTYQAIYYNPATGEVHFSDYGTKYIITPSGSDPVADKTSEIEKFFVDLIYGKLSPDKKQKNK